jgi:16S rRNA C967 or C1407 C5-methylase (RsmB/RsmF family)
MNEKQALKLLKLKPQKSIRINSNRDINSIKNKIKKQKINIWSIKWSNNCYKTDSLQQIKRSDVFKNSDVVIQNASSFCPVINLMPEPNEKILDLCAAPGLKTSHISDLAENRAEITANELSFNRYNKMVSFFKEYGCKVNSINSNGLIFARQSLKYEYYDKVLVDAPCSGEAGINIDDPNAFNSWSIKNIKRLQSLQLNLLKSAYKMAKVGGTIVYSTCTINAEENEVVVSKFLKQTSCKLEKVNSGDLPTIVLNSQYLSRDIDPNILNMCARIIPSENNEAFFVAKLIKTAENEFLYK